MNMKHWLLIGAAVAALGFTGVWIARDNDAWRKLVFYGGAATIIGLKAYGTFAKRVPWWLVIVLAGIGIITDRKSTRLNSSHVEISYAVFCLKKKKKKKIKNIKKQKKISK